MCPSSVVPNQYEQAMEAVRDGLTRTELTNMLYDLPAVMEVLVDGEGEDWRPTRISVGFKELPGRATCDVDRIMRLAGWKSDGTTFGHYRRRHYIPQGTEYGTAPMEDNHDE